MTTTSSPPSSPSTQPALGRVAPTTIPARPSPPVNPDPQTPPTHLMTTMIGALAVIAATSAIPPMISGDGWFWPTVEVVLVIWLVGVGARLARVPAVGVVVLQILGASVALTALFTVGGLGGVLPNGAVLGEAGELITGAWDQIRTTVSPAPASTELAFLICLSVGATALIVDVLIAVCRAPALVALPLLCVYSVPASIDLGMLPWLAFAAPAMLYALLLTASGLSGRRLGAGAGPAQVVTGVALASIAIVTALLVANTVTGVGTAGRLPRSAAGPSTAIGLSPFASLYGSLQRSDPVELLRVYGLSSAHYLRTIGLQKWTPGEGWSVDELTDGSLPDAPLADNQQQVTITSSNYRDQFLPIYNGTASLSGVGEDWSYDAALESVHRAEAVTPDPYQVWAAFNQPTSDELRADTAIPGGTLTETGSLPAEVVSIAEQVTAGATTPFDKADALRSYFTNPANGFTYSLDVPAGNSGDPLVDFLNNKQGYCEQYASAMAIMLRAVGVPARVAVGFTQGAPADDGSHVISSNDAHAWVEVLFTRAGWVQFDPTPLGGGQGGQQGFTETGGSTPAATPTASAPTGGLNADDDNPTGGGAPTAPSLGAASTAATDTGPSIPAGVWWAALALLLAGAAAAGPTVVRARRRRHRLALADAGGAGAAAAAWREIEDLAIDHDVGLNPAESARSTANRLARAAHLTAQGRAELRAVVTAAEHGWYGGAGTGVSLALPDRPAGQASPENAGSVPAAGVASAAATGAIAVADRAGTDGDADVGVAEVPEGAGAPGDADAAPAAAPDTAGHHSPAAGLGAAPRTLAKDLQHNVPLQGMDRLIPRSVRPAWWRD